MMDGKKKNYNQLLKKHTFHLISLPQTVAVAQLVRASDCGSEGRGFEPHQSPNFFPFSALLIPFEGTTTQPFNRYFWNQ